MSTRKGRPSSSASASTAMPSPMPKGWLATMTIGPSGRLRGGQSPLIFILTSMRSSISPKTWALLPTISVFQRS